jgi:LmbE family N-acetylglucosaminyl deacetylase
MSRVLVLATHPDDEVLGCGGVMARHAAAGDEVHVLIMTRGVEELFAPELIARTRAELAASNSVIGVKTATFLDFPAPKLDTISGHQLADALLGELRKIRPDVLYIPHQGDLHSDHKATYWAALVAARPTGGACPSRVLCYETLSETEWGAPTSAEAFVPTVFVNITEYIPIKLRAMACYETQLQAPPHPRSLKAIEALAIYRGSAVSVAAAEAFMLVREVSR